MKIISDMHTHTMVSHHAYSTVKEICQQAFDAGLSAVAITDHAYGMPDAANTWHFGSMWVIPRRLCGVYVFRGAEANIMDYNGSIDLTLSDSKKLDYIVASLHEYCIRPGSAEEHTCAYEGVIANPYVDALGHPGDLPFPFDYRHIVKMCSVYGKSIEFNVHAMRKNPASIPVYRMLAGLCAEYGTRIVVSSDAHFYTEVGDFGLVSNMLDELHFPSELMLNGSLNTLLGYINSKETVNEKFG